jgi:hypothetical protein
MTQRAGGRILYPGGRLGGCILNLVSGWAGCVNVVYRSAQATTASAPA